MEIVLNNCTIQVAQNEHKQKVLMFVDPKSGIKVIIPLADRAAKALAQGLSTSGIIVPDIVPPRNIVTGNGS